MTRLRAAAATDPGLVRSSNQDVALVAEGLVAVADGMGGHAGGEVAATTAVRVLDEAFGADRSAAGLVAATRKANVAIFERSERQKDLRGMGTTLTAAALVTERGVARLAVINVGDSRAYLVTEEGLLRLTEDHSLVEEMVRHGELTEAEAAVHPHRHILTRALGIDAGVEVDAWAIEPRPGSRLLLCSDGLTNECSDEEIAAILRAHAAPDAAAEALVARALEHGGSDNVTVVVADVVGEGAAGSAPSAGDRVEQRTGGADGTAPEGDGSARRAAPAPARTGKANLATRDSEPSDLAGSGGVALRPPPHRARRPSRPAGAAPTPAPARAPRSRRRRREDRVVTIWSVLFVLAFVGVLGGTVGFVEWFVRATYFLAFDGNRVAIYEGRPGGFLWFKPHPVELTSLTRAKVFSPYVALLEKGMVETSFPAARKVAAKLGDANAFLALPSAGSPTPSGSSGTLPSASSGTSPSASSGTSGTSPSAPSSTVTATSVLPGASGATGAISTSGTTGAG